MFERNDLFNYLYIFMLLVLSISKKIGNNEKYFQLSFEGE